MYYRHDLDYTYPERSDQHMLVLESTRTLELDEGYDYMPSGFWFGVKRALVASLLHLIVFPLTRLTHGLRIEGRKNLKKHRAALKGGAITISNHVFMWDYLCVQKAIFPLGRKILKAAFSPLCASSVVCPFPRAIFTP